MSQNHPYFYPSGEPVLLGDEVVIRRSASKRLLDLLRNGGLPVSKWRGYVDYVYDPSKPSPPWGDNDHGFSVKLPNGHSIFGANTEDLELIKRKDPDRKHQLEELFKGLSILCTWLELDPDCQWIRHFKNMRDEARDLLSDGFTQDELNSLSSSIRSVYSGMGRFNDY